MPSGPLRARVETVSVPALERLGRFPAWLVALVVGVLVATALLVGSPWAALGLLPVVAFMAWLTYLSWPRLTTLQRLVRVAVLGCLALWAALRLTGAL